MDGFNYQCDNCEYPTGCVTCMLCRDFNKFKPKTVKLDCKPWYDPSQVNPVIMPLPYITPAPVPKVKLNKRIGLTGAGGTGKTTLAKALAEKYDIPYVSEGVRTYMKENNISHLRELDSKGPKKLQDVVLARKMLLELSNESFIADRTSIDTAAYCLRWCSRDDELQEWVKGYVDACLRYASLFYDIIVFVPTGVFPLEDDGVRSSKPAYQFEVQTLMWGLVGQMEEKHKNGPELHLLKRSSVEDRVKEVADLCL